MKNKTKILYLITGLNTGGAELLIKELSKRLDKQRFEVVVVSIAPPGEVGEIIKKDGGKVLSLNAKFKYNPLIIWQLSKLLRQENPDILHTHLFHADFLGRVLGKLARVPIIISTHHNTYIGGRMRDFLMRLTNFFSSLDIAVAKTVRESIIKRGIAIKEKIVIIYNGVNFERFTERDKSDSRRELSIPKDCKVIVSVGRLHKQKGYIYLIDAMRGVVDNQEDTKLYILGEGKERVILEKRIKENNLDNHIHLVGNVKNVNDYLRAADIFVMPSLWEGFSLVAVEAAYTKLPIVGTSTGILPEIIKEGENGFLVESGNPKVLAEKIKYVLELPEEKRKEIGKNSCKTVEEKFSIKRMASEYEKLYLDIYEK